MQVAERIKPVQKQKIVIESRETIASLFDADFSE